MTRKNKKYKILRDPIGGYKRLDPIPDEGELTKFYQHKYYDLIRKGGRASEIRRLMSGGKQARKERDWLRDTLYKDISHILNKFAPGKHILDVGCGTGEFLSYLKEKGFNCIGVEPSYDAAKTANSRGLIIHKDTIENFVKYHNSKDIKAFDSAVLINVLEHVPDPQNVIKTIKKILIPGGIICIRVPNDFSDIQLAAKKRLKNNPWWIATPDHINYFNFQSLHFFLKRLGFEVVYSQGDFPMEFFLLMGENYINKPEIGDKCHQKRVCFDMSIPEETRRRLYKALAEIGIGRDCLVFARVTK